MWWLCLQQGGAASFQYVLVVSSERVRVYDCGCSLSTHVYCLAYWMWVPGFNHICKKKTLYAYNNGELLAIAVRRYQ
jgi:hypothetical protein